MYFCFNSQVITSDELNPVVILTWLTAVCFWPHLQPILFEWPRDCVQVGQITYCFLEATKAQRCVPHGVLAGQILPGAELYFLILYGINLALLQAQQVCRCVGIRVAVSISACSMWCPHSKKCGFYISTETCDWTAVTV